MSKLAEDFLSFLRKKQEKTGKSEFTTLDYMDFKGWEVAREELSKAGIIKWERDVLGTITLLGK